MSTISQLRRQPDANQEALFEDITRKGVDFLFHFGAVSKQIESNSLSDPSLTALQSACADMARLVAQLRQCIATKPNKPSTVYLVPNAGGVEDRPKTMTFGGFFKRQAEELGLQPMPLEADLLISRVSQPGESGRFLADAFLSAYRKGVPFKHALFELVNLDADGFRLFHQILHIRHVPGWDNSALYQIEQQIKAIVEG
jgi:hypothetical protein